MLSNVYKILAPGGTYICVSRGAPETRLPYFSESSQAWTIETLKVLKKQTMGDEAFERIDQEPYYYVYICDKKY